MTLSFPNQSRARPASLALALVLASLAFGAGSAARADFVKLNPAASFLKASGETPPNSVPVALSAHGLAPGDFVAIQRVGDFKPGSPYADASVSMIGVFSGSSTLLAATQMNRVPDAIDAGADVATGKTYYNSVDTDIPQDFLVTDGATVRVPTGATHLFVCPADSLYTDNTDPDNDYGVSITRVTLAEMVASALATGAGLLKPSPTTALELDAVPSGAPPPLVEIRDAVRWARRAAGLDP